MKLAPLCLYQVFEGESGGWTKLNTVQLEAHEMV